MSNMIIRSDEISKPLKIVEGRAILFFAKVLDDNKLGVREYWATLEKNDVFAPHKILNYKNKNYVLILVSQKANFVETIHDEKKEFDFLATSMNQVFRNKIVSKNIEDLFVEFLEDLIKKKKNLQNTNRENHIQISKEINRKVRYAGEIANMTTNDFVNTEKNVLAEAIYAMAKACNLPINTEINFEQFGKDEFFEAIEYIAVEWNWRLRKVKLNTKYYEQSIGPIIGFAKDKSPVFMSIDSNYSYYIDHKTGNKVEINSKNASDFLLDAYVVYETFENSDVSTKNVLKFVLTNCKEVIWGILISGIIFSIMNTSIPLAFGYITENVIPVANKSVLFQLFLLLVGIMICKICIGAVPTVVFCLFFYKQYKRFQMAVFDHVLRMPVNVLKTCNIGDLTQKILGGDLIHERMNDVFILEFVEAFFELSLIGLMYYFNKYLAGVAVCISVIQVIVFFVISRNNLKPNAEFVAAKGRMNGLLKQFVNGMNKIRAAGAEQQILSRFTDDLSVMVNKGFLMDRNKNALFSIRNFLMLFTFVLIYGLEETVPEMKVSLPVFLSFMLTFQMFQQGVQDLVSGIWNFLMILPDAKRVYEILKYPAEITENRHDCGKLDGSVEVEHIAFRYNKDMPLVLQDVSFQVKPGKFIALVGPSGAGKSSIIRLLLGFETPEKGAIYYSGKDLSNLNYTSIRSQMGVIMQSGKILQDTVLENVIIGTNCTEEDAWNALKIASMDEEVRQMDKGIHTVVSPETLSGGQQQRILIARALVDHPPIVIMDEATSALDNISQRNISKNMEEMNVSRIVIAHRLSTIKNADCIYVLDKGYVVQKGTYKELMAQEGLFKHLAQRQLAQGMLK
ncbi:MAG: ATP-binding cassette domain-containing protein [Alphaproteobacteria bacterium]|nr:ATP-binding cassette domain-containing protein [Alphaproteobacteria bacterium]